VDGGENGLVDLGNALSKNWQVAVTGNSDHSPYDELLEALTRRIRYLLEHNLDRLMTALYILDVPEQRFREAMAEKTIDKSAHDLARIVIEREMQRVETRRKYSGSSGANPDQIA
jgi:hypothetical protein